MFGALKMLKVKTNVSNEHFVFKMLDATKYFDENIFGVKIVKKMHEF